MLAPPCSPASRKKPPSHVLGNMANSGERDEDDLQKHEHREVAHDVHGIATVVGEQPGRGAVARDEGGDGNEPAGEAVVRAHLAADRDRLGVADAASQRRRSSCRDIFVAAGTELLCNARVATRDLFETALAIVEKLHLEIDQLCKREWLH